MTRAAICTAITAILYIAASVQAADAPRFEGADVHASAPSNNIRDNFMQGPFVGGGRFEIRKATMLDLIRLGWNVQADKIVGGPNWAGLDRFDILAKSPAHSSAADVRLNGLEAKIIQRARCGLGLRPVSGCLGLMS